MKFIKFFQNMSLLDWLLAVVFIAVVALLVNSLLPVYGWLIGIVVALGLLFLAKRRRDSMQKTAEGDRK